jgi:spermidine/putrescine transport system permease protein
VTFFLTGAEPTLPVYVFNQLRFGFTPAINALFTCIGVGSVTLLLLAAWLLTRRSGGERAASALPINIGI